MSEDINEKSALAPRLRFPEFREAGGWGHASLGQLFSERQEAGFTNLPLLSLMDKEGIVPQEETNRKNNSSADKSKYLRVVPGDIAYNTMRMWEGRSAYVGIEGLISPAYTVCIPAKGINSIFFSYHFKTEALIRQFRKYSQGLVKDTLNLKFEAFSRIEIAYPVEKREQQVIADCLSSLDELITAETQNLEALKTHKKGLMHQLFPREGETVPRLRFPEFREAEEWEEIALGDVCERIMDGTHFSPASKSGPFLYLTSKNVRPGALVLNDVSYISADEHRSIFARCPVKKNDLLLTKDGASTGNCTLNPLDFEFSLLSSVAVIRGDPNRILQEFLAQDFQSSHVQDQIADAISGQAITRITLEKIKLFKVWITSSHEQQRISDCLASLDELITAQSQKIDTLKTHKKGLMQQLFPVLDEAQA